MEHELVNEAWVCKKNFSCKFFQLHTKNHLSQIHVSLWFIASLQGHKARHHWGNKKNMCQVATLS